MRRLDEVQPPAPSRAFIEQTFDVFAQRHPWVRDEDVRPKSIAREMVEGYYGLRRLRALLRPARIEGLLLRYLLAGVQHARADACPSAREDRRRVRRDRVPARAARARRLEPGRGVGEPARTPARGAPTRRRAATPRASTTSRATSARCARACAPELHRLVRALAARDCEEAAALRAPRSRRSLDRRSASSARSRRSSREHGEIVFTPRARSAEWTRIAPDGAAPLDRRRRCCSTPTDDNDWCIAGEIDLAAEREPGRAAAAALQRIGT